MEQDGIAVGGIAKSYAKGALGAILALALLVILWLLLSVVFSFVGAMREEGYIWEIVTKDVVAPAVAAYWGFQLADKWLAPFHAVFAFGLFTAAVVCLAAANFVFAQETVTMVSSVLAMIATITGAYFYCRDLWRG